MDNKIKLLQYIKNNKAESFQLEHVLTMLLDNSVNFIEVRRFLRHKYPETEITWTELEDKQLFILARECEKYIKIN